MRIIRSANLIRMIGTCNNFSVLFIFLLLFDLLALRNKIARIKILVSVFDIIIHYCHRSILMYVIRVIIGNGIFIFSRGVYFMWYMVLGLILSRWCIILIYWYIRRSIFIVYKGLISVFIYSRTGELYWIDGL